MSAALDEPSVDPGIRALLDRWRARGDPAMFDGTVAEARARFAAQLAEAAGPPPRPPETGEAGGVPVRIHRPARHASDALVVFVHGGGWVLGGGGGYDAVSARLADDLGAVVAAIDHRLAPEHPFPIPLDDTLAAIRALRAEPPVADLDPRRWALVGDSAGPTSPRSPPSLCGTRDARRSRACSSTRRRTSRRPTRR